MCAKTKPKHNRTLTLTFDFFNQSLVQYASPYGSHPVSSFFTSCWVRARARVCNGGSQR